MNAADYGAKCDGATDDAAAFNRALGAIRSRTAAAGPLAWPAGHSGRLVAPSGKCVIRSTINATGLYGSGFTWDAWGTTLVCQVSGAPCVDGVGTGQANWLGLTIYGDAAYLPTIGLALGRITNNTIGADHNIVIHPTITGFFSLAPYYARSTETTLVLHGWFSNQQPHAYGAVFDGSNHFGIQSAFAGKGYPPDTFTSNNENTCDQCIVETFGSDTIPLWIGGSARHSWRNSYVLSTQHVSGVYIYSAQGIANNFLDLDIHFENTALSSLIKFGGVTVDTVVHGFRMRDNYPEQSGPIFARDAKVRTVTIEDADLHIGRLAGTSPSWWDDLAAYRVGGQIYSQDGPLRLPTAGFTGRYCVGVVCETVSKIPNHEPNSVTAVIASASLESNSIQIMAANTDGLVLANSAPVAIQTIRLPPLTGIQGQLAWVSSDSGVDAARFLTSAGEVILNAPKSIPPGSRRMFFGDGAVWHPIQ